MVIRCLRCNQFRERNEMETRPTAEYSAVTMCKECWKELEQNPKTFKVLQPKGL